MRLSHRSYDSILRILAPLYRCGTVREFTTRAVGLLPSVIHADGYGWFVHSVGPHPSMIDFVESEPRIITAAMIPRMGESARSHPFALRWANATEISALRFSEFPLSVRDRFLAENWDIHRNMGREYMTIPVSFGMDRIQAVSLRRDRKCFTEEDCLMMNLLAPHLRQAHANAILFEEATGQRSRSHESAEAGRGRIDAESTHQLTARESDVAFWVAQGKTNREIGLILGLSMRTAEKHTENILRKLGLENRTAIAIQFSRTGTSNG